MKSNLRELLLTYMFFRPDIGYMKGISHLAAMLLLALEFHDAFVCFANMINSNYFLSFCRMDMAQLKWRLEFFEQTLRNNCSELFEHFKFLNLTADQYFVDW